MHCANPACLEETLYFRSGSLHWIDRQPQFEAVSKSYTTRIIWLCATCSRSLVVETWRPAGQQLRCSSGEAIPVARS